MRRGQTRPRRNEVRYLPEGAAPLPVAPLPVLLSPAAAPEVDVLPLGVLWAAAPATLAQNRATARTADERVRWVMGFSLMRRTGTCGPTETNLPAADAVPVAVCEG